MLVSIGEIMYSKLSFYDADEIIEILFGYEYTQRYKDGEDEE